MARGPSFTQFLPHMGQRVDGFVGICSTDDDGLGTFEAVKAIDYGQTAMRRRLIDEGKGSIMLTLSDGCCENLCQILGNDNLLRIHLLMVRGLLFCINAAKVRKKVKSVKRIVKKVILTLNFFSFVASKRQKLAK